MLRVLIDAVANSFNSQGLDGSISPRAWRLTKWTGGYVLYAPSFEGYPAVGSDASIGRNFPRPTYVVAAKTGTRWSHAS